MIRKLYVDIELADGRVFERRRILAKYQKAWEEYSSKRGLKTEDHQKTAELFMAWVALKTEGDYPKGWDDFLDDVADTYSYLEGDVNPTPPAV